VFLYFDTVRNGPKPSGSQFHVGRLAIKPQARLRVPEEWAVDRATICDHEGPDGKDAVRLLCPADGVPSLLSNHALHALPKTVYNLTFWARSANGPVTLHANLYSGADYDFLHGSVSVPPGPEWRRYEMRLETRDFPENVHPALRLWVTQKEREVLVSGISLESVLPPCGVKIEVGKVESSGVQ
jgi:hypothetical protein